MTNKPTTLKERFGSIPVEFGFKAKMRVHQGTNILIEEPAPYPGKSDETICNRILNGKESGKNFLTPNTLNVVKETLQQRTKTSVGIIEENRLFNNLLSSQPLCFNFFGELYADKNFGLTALQEFQKNK